LILLLRQVRALAVESAWRRKRLTSTKVADRDSYVRVGLQPDEFLFANSAVIVETQPPMDPREARKAIGVLKSNNRVTVSKDGRRATWAVPEDLQLVGTFFRSAHCCRTPGER
jgi:hypothetical protein